MGWASANAENASFPALTLRGLNRLESPRREMGKRQEEKDHQSCEVPEKSEGKEPSAHGRGQAGTLLQSCSPRVTGLRRTICLLRLVKNGCCVLRR